MARPELGTKRVCLGCGAKYYDLHKDPIVCPKCGTVYEPVIVAARGRPVAAAAAGEDVDPVVDAELISLEDADAEASGKVAVVLDDDIEIEDDVADDDTFLEPEEEDDDDVTDLIGDGLEDDEET